MDQQISINLVTLLSGVVTLLLTGGAVGGLSVGWLASRIRHDPALILAIEGLSNSIPADKLTQLQRIGYGMVEAGELLVEASDGVPAASKP